MCLLIVLRGLHREHPILVAGNRDERTDRKAAPPGLFVGERQRILSPRDRLAGGTWLGINARGTFAGITNLVGAAARPGAPSRGLLPHLALDQADLGAGIAAVRAAVAGAAFGGFQLVLCDGARTVILRHRAGLLEEIEWPEPVLVLSNEHGPGELQLPLLERALGPAPAAASRLDLLQPLLQDEGGEDRHAVLKRGAGYGTVSSSLIAVPERDPRELIWLYAAGPPDATPYRNYGNLGRRLLEE